ncbi:hypothetical protein H257_06558 [Aphanomyces astaci]|uniref:Uncharacterized protein n=1 Tax=Aphanomyces astaci TaxID=112090 RepID=W4GKI6_APHAT|nr:hypothetical protein H257_06558 [Aphanomyces astaci]ETV80200.1 hypothetical protein H257_06558 [Aphanomyces astaci]|eukprot:XP_009830124.1 hypothetical protein H257_06558 [Aphanomyces astaci]
MPSSIQAVHAARERTWNASTHLASKRVLVVAVEQYDRRAAYRPVKTPARRPQVEGDAGNKQSCNVSSNLSNLHPKQHTSVSVESTPESVVCVHRPRVEGDAGNKLSCNISSNLHPNQHATVSVVDGTPESAVVVHVSSCDVDAVVVKLRLDISATIDDKAEPTVDSESVVEDDIAPCDVQDEEATSATPPWWSSMFHSMATCMTKAWRALSSVGTYLVKAATALLLSVYELVDASYMHWGDGASSAVDTPRQETATSTLIYRS